MTYTKDDFKALISDKLRRNFGLDTSEANSQQMFKACAMVIRDIMSEHGVATHAANTRKDAREVHYLSLEFLMGRSLEKNASNLGILSELKQAIDEMGFKAADLFELEPDAGLGNGGLGRLAACYLDSMTTLEIPATGYSICYELGIFKQKIIDGQQVELPDAWRGLGDAWLMSHPSQAETVRFGGSVETHWVNGRCIVEERGFTSVLAVPTDMKIAGYKTDFVNTLRLWEAKSAVPVDMNYYSTGEYLRAVESQAMAEVISKVLYPADNHPEGKSLRLKQQYFFVSATIQSVFRKHLAHYGTLSNFHEKHVIQINDTHPTLVIPEMMRLLLDDHGMSWEEAWYITTHTVAYTNHTVLAEALERWPQNLIESLLPRIWMIMCEINERYNTELRAFFHGDHNKLQEMGIIWGGEVRMANLCIAACFAVNGVSALHSDILRKDVFHSAWLRTPEKFQNVTNGVDHRRWLAEANPELHQLLCDCIGDEYLIHPEKLAGFEAYADDESVLRRMAQIKRANKERFAAYLKAEYGIEVNVNAVFDVQVKRLHEYKRQLLNVLNILRLYLELKQDPKKDFVPRVFIFGAKAAPGYAVAKRIIELINSVSYHINNDPDCAGKLQVFFLENYRVSLAEKLMPASEISEQISTAGKEASGTGNMKFMMNGAVTIGTLDGANVEMHEQLGDENIFIFGLKAHEVEALKARGYNSYEYYNASPVLRDVLDLISHGFNDGKSYADITNRLLYGQGCPADEYLLLADFESYRHTQDLIANAYQDHKAWNRMAVINVARSGIFAADRSVSDYAENIWHVEHR